MSERMINIEGRGKVSEDTIVQALNEKFGTSEYQFKAGDVVRMEDSGHNLVRVIIPHLNNYGLVAINADGMYCCRGGQPEFKDAQYKKIGELRDYLP